MRHSSGSTLFAKVSIYESLVYLGTMTDAVMFNFTIAASSFSLQSIPMMTVIAIGIGSHVDPAELAMIATDSNHTFQVSTFDALQTIENDLTEATCSSKFPLNDLLFFDFSLTVKTAPHECVIRTGQP